MNSIAERYVRLVLEVGLYDADFVDAYYGPDEWKPSRPAEPTFPFARLHDEAEALLAKLDQITVQGEEEIGRLRYRSLWKQLSAVRTKVALINGTKLTFDEESGALYDAVAPHNTSEYYDRLLRELDALLPGAGSTSERLNRFRAQFTIPREKLSAVFNAAIAEGRARTLRRIELPQHESFVVEYVTEKPWSGYNWYKGNSYSVIQVNTDLPIFIDRAVDLACHEGYPGHHVYNALMEKNLVRERKWVEFCVYPLTSPQSLIAEGSANFGIEVAFPGAERAAFERERLFPLAGLEAKRADEYYRVHALTMRLHYAGNEASRGYLDGTLSRDAAVDWLVTYGLYARDRAEQRIRFIEKYRSYVINYNLGLDIVRDWVDRQGGTESNPEKRWEIFRRLLSNPYTPSALR